ncbi:trp operon leader peptide [Salmonella enterica subsp. enterica serovar Mishmarhaemek]|nr:trp operon leader peptide [Salmonella enterica subsp. enterica serovar Telelkebir]EEJ1271960.1 trp operon leader peptide [Salmonella enterica]EHJ0509692.1 trp operon leader peptide [Salmonella enterica subsp. enterica serovar Mishmarhaemek]ELT5231331.1 trp operon leader peptide [Salmonella enterica]HAU3171214.1 trp operon leader peptide [Salmonella enterica]
MAAIFALHGWWSTS